MAVLELIDVSEIEEEDEANTDLALVFLGVSMLKHQRCAPVLCEWLNWARHISLLHCEGQFTQMYHMCYTSYCKLLTVLSPALEVDAIQGNRRSQGQGLITPQLILHCLIHYMAGGSFHDIRTSTENAKATFFNCIHWGIDAFNNCLPLP